MARIFSYTCFLFLVVLGAYFALTAERGWEYASGSEVSANVTAAPFLDINELLPDLVPLPARDLSVVKENEELLLRFSATYFNQGRGSLDLVADPETKGVQEDIERDVFQHIHKKDGTVRERRAGRFRWHEEHLHFHFTDFILYELRAVDDERVNVQKGLEKKATFCVRDVSRVFLNLANAPPAAEFKVCLRERQGVSVGWGDSYLYNYPDQDLVIDNLPSGQYELSFLVNPRHMFEESNYTNNRSFVRIALDVEKKKVTVLSESPKDYPEVEHVYLEQPFGEGN